LTSTWSFFARNDFLGTIARGHAVRGFRGPIRWRRHDFGRTRVCPDDRRLPAAGRSDIGAIGKSRARPNHRQSEDDDNRLPTAAAALLDRLFGFLVIAVLIAVRVIRIGLTVSLFLRVGIALAV